jgi:hypothetical protein
LTAKIRMLEWVILYSIKSLTLVPMLLLGHLLTHGRFKSTARELLAGFAAIAIFATLVALLTVAAVVPGSKVFEIFLRGSTFEFVVLASILSTPLTYFLLLLSTNLRTKQFLRKTGKALLYILLPIASLVVWLAIAGLGPDHA